MLTCIFLNYLKLELKLLFILCFPGRIYQAKTCGCFWLASVSHDWNRFLHYCKNFTMFIHKHKKCVSQNCLNCDYDKHNKTQLAKQRCKQLLISFIGTLFQLLLTCSFYLLLFCRLQHQMLQRPLGVIQPDAGTSKRVQFNLVSSFHRHCEDCSIKLNDTALLDMFNKITSKA